MGAKALSGLFALAVEFTGPLHHTGAATATAKAPATTAAASDSTHRLPARDALTQRVLEQVLASDHTHHTVVVVGHE